MTLTIHNNLEQRSEEWHALRCGMVTASSVGALLTVAKPGAIAYACPSCDATAGHVCVSLRGGAPIKTTHPERVTLALTIDAEPVVSAHAGDESENLALILAAERITGHAEDTFTTRDMWRGIEAEPFARDTYAANFAPVHEVGFMVRTFKDGTRIGYSPDGIVGKDGLIEVKAPRQKGHLATILGGTVPAHHMAQIQCGLLVSGREWCDFVSFYGGMPLYPVRVYADVNWHSAIRAGVAHLEERIANILTTYQAAVTGLPMTERLPDPFAEIAV